MGTHVAEFSDTQVFNVWLLGMGGSIVAIVIVVLLIWGITRTALQIDLYLDEVVLIARRIVANTDPLWELEKTANLGTDMLETVQLIEADANSVLTRAAAGGGPLRSK